MHGSGSRIRVARIIARLNVGGPAIHVISLTSRLPQEEFETRLFVGEVSPGEAEMSDVLRRERVEPVRIPGLGRSIRLGNDVLALARLIAELRRFRPDIGHTHTAKGGALGRIAAQLCRVPQVVHTYHGHVFEGYFHPALAKAIVMTERALGRATDAVVTISPRQHYDITRRFRIVAPETASIIPLGFDLTRFDGVSRARGRLRADLGVGDAPTIAVVGRLTRIKDHDLLFRAFRLIPEGP